MELKSLLFNCNTKKRKARNLADDKDLMLDSRKVVTIIFSGKLRVK